MGHNGCDGSQASGPWAIGSGYRFIGKNVEVVGIESRTSSLVTQNQTLGLSCLDGYSKSRPDSVEEHARTAKYRCTLQRLRVVIRTLNRDCTKYCVKYSVHYALLLLLLCIIVLFAHSSDCVMEQQDLAKVLELLVAGNTSSVR